MKDIDTDTNERLSRLERGFTDLTTKMTEFMKRMDSGNMTCFSEPEEEDDATSDKDNAINEVIDNFDFEKVHKVMELLEWKWAFCGGSDYGIPSTQDLIDLAERILGEAWDEKTRIATGGFVAEYDDSGDGKPWLELSFVVEESQTL